MRIKIYQIDAFTNKIFGGNPAAVCPLDKWLSDDVLQKVAMENNLAETAFYVKQDEAYHIRWFTPAVEVDLCGHATLATAHVLFNFENHTGNKIVFDSRSGKLCVTKQGALLTLDFPTDDVQEIPLTESLNNCFNHKPTKAFKGKTDYMLIFENELQISTIQPDLLVINEHEGRGIIVTAKGNEVDFVSRFFAPQSGIDEDPVTGSAHTTLTPYWAKVLGKTDLSAIQLSARKGHLQCKYLVNRVEISGQAMTYLIGHIEIY